MKWKGLRDTYRRELKKQRSNNSIQNGGENARDPSWTHYSSMNFLREYMGSNNNQTDLFQFQGWPTDDMAADEAVSPGDEVFSSFMSAASIAEVVTSKADSAASASGDEAAKNEVKTEPQSSENKDSMVVDSPVRRRRPIPRLSRLKEHRLRSRLARKHTKLRNGMSRPAGEEDSDDDLYFFKSLIPYVKSLPPTRKLYLRSEIHNLVLREIMTDATGGGSHGVIPLEHVAVGLNA